MSVKHTYQKKKNVGKQRNTQQKKKQSSHNIELSIAFVSVGAYRVAFRDVSHPVHWNMCVLFLPYSRLICPILPHQPWSVSKVACKFYGVVRTFGADRRHAHVRSCPEKTDKFMNNIMVSRQKS